MPRKYLIIGIVVLVLMALVTWYGIVSSGKKNADGTKAPVTLSDFFPFGKGSGQNTGTTTPATTTGDATGTSSSTPTTTSLPKLRQISSSPVAGGIAFSRVRPILVKTDTVPVETAPAPTATTTPAPKTPTKKTAVKTPPVPTETVTAVRYVERATAHVYETVMEDNKETRVSNTTIPRIAEAFFGNNGDSLILRYLKDDNQTIETFTGAIIPPPPVATTQDGTPVVETFGMLKGTFLPENIRSLAVSPDTTKIVYVSDTPDGSVITSALFDGTKRAQILRSPFSEWTLSWPGTLLMTATTKPSGSANGYAYSISQKNGILQKLLGNIAGLTTLASPNGKLILYGASRANGTTLSLYDSVAGKSYALGLNTLPEKCVWSKDSTAAYCGSSDQVPAGLYPDAWYQGLVSFNDNLWKISIGKNSTATQMLAEPVTVAGKSLDVSTPFIDDLGHYLFFINKNDSMLWSLDLR